MSEKMYVKNIIGGCKAVLINATDNIDSNLRLNLALNLRYVDHLERVLSGVQPSLISQCQVAAIQDLKKFVKEFDNLVIDGEDSYIKLIEKEQQNGSNTRSESEKEAEQPVPTE